MKAGLIALASALAVGAIPADRAPPFDGAVESIPPPVDDWTALQGGVANLVGGAVKKVTEAVLSAFKAPPTIFGWRGFGGERELEFIQHGDITYELIRMPKFPDYQIRLKSPSLCDPSVKQYSGYFDIGEDKHLFFWFFEAREAEPKKAPLVLWLNGGPGCSSIGGLLFELGPCSIRHGGKDTRFNKYSWNTHANMIFLDQPVNVGYSYSETSAVDNTPTAAEDVWVFLELFLNRFQEYSELPFHVAAESYGGRYGPLIASAIHRHNQELTLAPIPDPALVHINLASVILANGFTEPYTQFSTIPKYACSGPYPVYDDPEGPQCQALRSKVPTCQRLIQSCYAFESRLTCVPAALYCWSQLLGPFQELGLNPYDVRRKCDKSKDGDLCYKEMGWVETYANNATVKRDLGVNPKIEFKTCNMDVNQAFFAQGDGMHNSASVLPELLESGVRLLVYAGNADFMCNFIGNFEWMLRLKSPFQEEFGRAKSVVWKTTEGKVAGEVRAVGGFGAGNFTYVQFYEAGHMVPFDQPEAAFDLFLRWITNTPLTHV